MASTRFFHYGPCRPPNGPAATVLSVGTVIAVLGLIVGAVAVPFLGPGQSWVLWVVSGLALVCLATHMALALAHVFGLPVPVIFYRDPAQATTSGDAESARDGQDRVV
jgi:hypothetical protein